MTGLVTPGMGVGWSEAEPFHCAKSVDLVQEVSVTRETNRVEGWAVMKGWHFGKYYPSDFLVESSIKLTKYEAPPRD